VTAKGAQNQEESREPGHRLGPRPLPLHLYLAASTWTSSRAGLQLLRRGLLDWKGELATAARELSRDLSNADSKALDQELDAEIRRRLYDLVTGILAYRRHPYRRALKDPPAIWSKGAARLLDYGAGTAGAKGPPLLVVPSLINRAYILDISARKSLLRYLAAQGFRPLLADWGYPGEAEKDFGLSEYIGGYLVEMLDATIRRTKQKPIAVGYCMGGLLTLALSVLRPDDVKGQVLLATPWDFHCARGEQARLAAAMLGPLEPVIERFGELPVDLLQAMFASLDPLGSARKFQAFAGLVRSANGPGPITSRIEDFVALEDWLNDGVPLVAEVARECLGSWYGANEPARGRWMVAGQAVKPESVTCPALAVIPAQDRIVPPESAESLAAAMPNVERMTPPLGHIGMVVGSRAEAMLWGPLAEWLKTAAAGPDGRAQQVAKR
jgi:poly[(R)-3-hydroxyalkanoate] polymerase subunit PhaC